MYRGLSRSSGPSPVQSTSSHQSWAQRRHIDHSLGCCVRKRPSLTVGPKDFTSASRQLALDRRSVGRHHDLHHDLEDQNSRGVMMPRALLHSLTVCLLAYLSTRPNTMAYPGGAPYGACSTWTPIHPGNPTKQAGNGGYQVTHNMCRGYSPYVTYKGGLASVYTENDVIGGWRMVCLGVEQNTCLNTQISQNFEKYVTVFLFYCIHSNILTLTWTTDHFCLFFAHSTIPINDHKFP